MPIRRLHSERVLGRGGMGVVYQARQVHLDRHVAIKMIRSGALASEEEVARFYAEARSAAKLDHANIVTVYQCGEFDGHHYFSMDFVRGTDLATKLDEGPMPPRDAARYVPMWLEPSPTHMKKGFCIETSSQPTCSSMKMIKCRHRLWTSQAHRHGDWADGDGATLGTPQLHVT